MKWEKHPKGHWFSKGAVWSFAIHEQPSGGFYLAGATADTTFEESWPTLGEAKFRAAKIADGSEQPPESRPSDEPPAEAPQQPQGIPIAPGLTIPPEFVEKFTTGVAKVFRGLASDHYLMTILPWFFGGGSYAAMIGLYGEAHKTSLQRAFPILEAMMADRNAIIGSSAGSSSVEIAQAELNVLTTLYSRFYSIIKPRPVSRDPVPVSGVGGPPKGSRKRRGKKK